MLSNRFHAHPCNSIWLLFNRKARQGVKLALLVAAGLTLAACDSLNKRETPDPTPQARVEPQKREPSPAALTSVSERDVRFAQTALKQLGYKLGAVDGIWGARSAKAMRAFEQSKNLASAGGALSELNLYALSKATKVKRSEIESSIKQSKGLRAKLDNSVALESAPQLIIVEQSYEVLAKANPYSEVITTLQPGTGIYVISIQDGWFEIESLSRQRGYIRERN